jgi:3-oxoacyl-[acyl-carrier-protein] synthase-3
MNEDSAGNFRSLDNLVMKGDEVFNFVQREVPPMIEQLLDRAKMTKEEVDFFMFHQPNKFILNKVADKLGIQRERMPSNIVENFGNSSGVTIPMAITYNLGERLMTESYLMCLAGFGVGLTWAAMIIRIGKLKFNQIVYF